MGANHENDDLVEGREYSGPPRRLTMARMLAFSGGPLDQPDWPARNLHTDAGKAKDAGLSAPIASGIQYEGHLIELLLSLFGESWFRRGRLHVKYPRPVLAGDVVQPKAVVRSKVRSGRGWAYELDVWCENQGSEKVLVGTAAFAPPSGMET